MPITSAQTTVTTTATLLVAGDAQAEEIHLHSISGTAVYIGGSDVTASTGYKMDTSDKIVLQNHENAIYGITSTATALMAILVISK